MFGVGSVVLDRFMPSRNMFQLLQVVSRCFTLFHVLCVLEIVQVV